MGIYNNNIYKNKYFYLTFILGLVFFNYIFGNNISDYFSSFFVTKNIEIGNNYNKKSDFYDLSSNLTLVNLTLGKGDYVNFSNIGTSLDYLKTAQNLVNIDTIALLDGSSNKALILESHIKQIESLLNKINSSLLVMNDSINQYKQMSLNCQNEKIQSDNQFFQGLSSNDIDMVNQGLNESLEKGPCYIKNRTYANSYSVVYDKLTFYKNILKRKYDILIQNQDMILQNYNLFKENTLEQLINLRNDLASFRITQD